MVLCRLSGSRLSVFYTVIDIFVSGDNLSKQSVCLHIGGVAFGIGDFQIPHFLAE